MPRLRLGVGREASEVSPTALSVGFEKKKRDRVKLSSRCCVVVFRAWRIL